VEEFTRITEDAKSLPIIILRCANPEQSTILLKIRKMSAQMTNKNENVATKEKRFVQ
jgi:hypothetical protein